MSGKGSQGRRKDYTIPPGTRGKAFGPRLLDSIEAEMERKKPKEEAQQQSPITKDEGDKDANSR